MKTLKTALLTSAITVAMGMVAVPANAGTVAGFGGSTEITQIANQVQLGASFVQDMKRYANELKRYKNQLDQMRKLDPTKLALMMAGVNGIKSTDELEINYKATTGILDSMGDLSKRMDTLVREGGIAVDVIGSLQQSGHKLTPTEYFTSLQQLSKQRQGKYDDRLKALKDASRSALSDIARINKLAASAPTIETQAEGFGSMLQANAVMAGQIANVGQVLYAAEQRAVEQDRREIAKDDKEAQKDALKQVWVENYLLGGNGSKGSK